MRQHFVTFLSPGTLFSEQSTKPIESWSPGLAAAMATAIQERHGATPYGFHFSTDITHDPVPDGEGGTLKVESKEVDRSGTYFLTGKIIRIEDVPEGILKSNMRCNGYPVVVENTNSYKTTMPFEQKDFIVDLAGTILVRGDDPELVAYRAMMIERHRLELEADIATAKEKTAGQS